ncbi:Mss4-like protein [Xylariomycetidae sp. FL0641]|nr:Mss4-like protein [Xylariomycetidae sp. FL0641]
MDPAKSQKGWFPNGGAPIQDGATATCYCGEVSLAAVSAQTLYLRNGDGRPKAASLANPSQAVDGENMTGAFVCTCTDCRKITASMFASNFMVKDEGLRWLRGQDKLSKFTKTETIASGHAMTNYFCSNCGTLMNRVSTQYPGLNFLRIGTVDDFTLHDTKLKPTIELFTDHRVSWFHGVPGAKSSFKGPPEKL